MMAPPVPVAVIGLGAMGARHAACVAAHPGARLAAIVDVDPGRRAHATWDCPFLHDATALIGKVAGAIIAVPTALHAVIATQLLEAGIACLVEKPFVASPTEAARTMAAARSKGAALQVGHIERFNPAVRALFSGVAGEQPQALAARRISGASARVTDIDVVLDLMVHDIDLVLALKRAPPTTISAAGGRDHAVALLGFADGGTASLTASRIAPTLIRDLDVFLAKRMFHVDYAARSLTESRAGAEAIAHPVAAEDQMRAQLDAFLAAIHGAPPAVSAADTLATMEVAWRVRTALGL
jgi:predicted dehydrogenase